MILWDDNLHKQQHEVDPVIQHNFLFPTIYQGLGEDQAKKYQREINVNFTGVFAGLTLIGLAIYVASKNKSQIGESS